VRSNSSDLLPATRYPEAARFLTAVVMSLLQDGDLSMKHGIGPSAVREHTASNLTRLVEVRVRYGRE
jgi:hypothetical protein